MKGIRKFQLSSKNILFDIELHRNVTVIRGDGATYKTMFCNMLRAAHVKGSGVHLRSYQAEVLCLTDQEFNADNLVQYKNKDVILVFDESSSCIRTTAFREAIESTGCYFILITRNRCDCFGMSMKELYEFTYSDSVDLSKRVISMNPLYKSDCYGILSNQSQVITEDSNAGKQFFNRAYGHEHVYTSHGKSNIPAAIKEYSDSIVVVDGAAFGFEVEDVLPLLSAYNCYLVAKESFKYVLLKSGILKNLVTINIDEPEVDSKKYLTWERFYTDYIQEITSGTVFEYNKVHLNEAYYISQDNKQKILDVYKLPYALFSETTSYFE